MNKRLHVIFILLVTLFEFVSSTTYNCSSNAPCGCSPNSAVVSKIVGGEPASSQTWGWAASLRYSSSDSHFCGGSIISSTHILTAAHCTIGLESPSDVRVYIGSIYLSVVSQVRSVSAIHIHPSYSRETYINDISILKLSSPIDLRQSGVDLVCLPNVSANVLASGEYPSAGINLVAIGWGVTQEGSHSISSVLQQVTIQSVAASSIYCKNVELNDTSTQFCAGVMPGGMKGMIISFFFVVVVVNMKRNIFFV